MELSIPNLDFTISVNACHDEIMHKMQVLTNMEIQLLRKFQHQVNNSDMHYKMVHDVRVLIINLQQVYKDVKEYFDEMGIKFIYDFFRKIQVLMVCGYNFLSQALLVNVDKIEDKKTKDAKKSNTLQCNVCKCTCEDQVKNKKRQIKEVEQYDYKISMLQNEQQKIASEIQAIYEKIMIQKPMVEKTKPSLAIRELQDMKEHIENVMESTNSIFQETYMMKYVEFKNYLTQIKKPEDIVDYFIKNMNFNMKEKFLKAMQKAIYKAQNMQERLQRMHLKDVEIQTDQIKQPERDSIYRGFSSLKPQKNGFLLTKQRKFNQKMVAEVQYMRKQINTLISQNNELKKQVQKKQQERRKFKQNFETLEQLYNKRSYDLQVTQSENKWLANEKQAQTKKLRLEIIELKKEQVQMISEQIQIFIAPNYETVSTQTEIVHFQNQVDNEIINVLKKSNEKMIQNLNEKQRKIRELVSIRNQYILLKDCKILCLGFLDDLREVTTYKINEINKNEQKTVQKNKIREPIIPLNENTLNNSIIITINKLTDDIKTLLLSYDLVKKRGNEKRQSTLSKSSSARSSRNSSRKSSKLSELSPETAPIPQTFFRNAQTRKSSLISLKKDTETFQINEVKKSLYLEQFLSKTQEANFNSIAENDMVESDVIKVQKSQKKKTSQESISQQSDKENNYSQKTTQINTTNQITKKSSFQQQMRIQINTQIIPEVKKKVDNKQKSVQTENLKLRISSSYSQQFHQISTFNNANNAQQQTDILSEQLTLFQKQYNLQTKQFQKLKIELESIKCTEHDSSQLSNRSKNQYIRKPGGRFTVDRINSSESDRNYVPVNHIKPVNDADISLSINEHVKKVQNNESVSAKTSPTAFEHSASTANIYKPPIMTLQSRLQQLINPTKVSKSASASNLVIFKKSQKQYRKRSSRMTFQDMKEIDKHLKEKQKQFRNSCQQESLLITTESQSRWKDIINKLDSNIQNQKENIKTKIKNQSFVKSKFVIQEESKNQSVHSNESTLIGVSKKSPQQRERKNSPNFQSADNAFGRTVRQLLLTSQSKQRLFKRIQEIFQEMQKERSSKRTRKTLKTSFTSRDLRSQKTKKELTQIFKLGRAVQY